MGDYNNFTVFVHFSFVFSSNWLIFQEIYSKGFAGYVIRLDMSGALKQSTHAIMGKFVLPPSCMRYLPSLFTVTIWVAHCNISVVILFPRVAKLEQHNSCFHRNAIIRCYTWMTSKIFKFESVVIGSSDLFHVIPLRSSQFHIQGRYELLRDIINSAASAV